MNIALIGYGKMGKAIEQEALERGHKIVLKIDKDDNTEQWKKDLSKADVAIEFTNPSAAVENIYTCFDANVPVVVGTTGWYKHFEEVSEICKKKNGAFFHATNFSLGVNIMFELNKKLAQIMSGLHEYKVEIKEIHHTQKLDAPSGTAISLAEQVIESHAQYNEWNLQEDVIFKQGSVPIYAERVDNVPGTHYVEYKSAIDTIGISHVAHSRKGFALGAVLAAEFINGKKGVFNMSYLINQIINHGN